MGYITWNWIQNVCSLIFEDHFHTSSPILYIGGHLQLCVHITRLHSPPYYISTLCRYEWTNLCPSLTNDALFILVKYKIGCWVYSWNMSNYELCLYHDIIEGALVKKWIVIEYGCTKKDVRRWITSRICITLKWIPRFYLWSCAVTGRAENSLSLSSINKLVHVYL